MNEGDGVVVVQIVCFSRATHTEPFLRGLGERLAVAKSLQGHLGEVRGPF